MENETEIIDPSKAKVEMSSEFFIVRLTLAWQNREKALFYFSLFMEVNISVLYIQCRRLVIYLLISSTTITPLKLNVPI